MSDAGIRRRREVGGSVDRAQEERIRFPVVVHDDHRSRRYKAPRLEIKIEIEKLLWLAAKREREKCRGTNSK